MSIPINLASEPFRRDRPMLVASGACGVALAALLGLLVFLILNGRERARDNREGVAQLSAQVDAASREQVEIEQILRQPANAQVFQRSLMLNSLVERKSISWTRIFGDLEHVMPYNVLLVQVRLPQINSRQEVSLDMIVGAKDWTPVQDFMNKLAESPLFGPVAVHSWDPPSQTQPLYQYRLSIDYAQKL
jgi:type IV pilus assembly protein PilN